MFLYEIVQFDCVLKPGLIEFQCQIANFFEEFKKSNDQFLQLPKVAPGNLYIFV